MHGLLIPIFQIQHLDLAQTHTLDFVQFSKGLKLSQGKKAEEVSLLILPLKKQSPSARLTA
jgi:hypothetical protein